MGERVWPRRNTRTLKRNELSSSCTFLIPLWYWIFWSLGHQGLPCFVFEKEEIFATYWPDLCLASKTTERPILKVAAVEEASATYARVFRRLS